MRIAGTLMGAGSFGAILLVAAAWPSLTAPVVDVVPFTIHPVSSAVDVGEAAIEPLFDLSGAGEGPIEACVRLTAAAEPGDDLRLYSAGVSAPAAADQIGIRITRTDPVEEPGAEPGIIPCDEMGSPTVALTRLSLSLADYADTRFSSSIGDSLGVVHGSGVAIDVKISLSVPAGSGRFDDVETSWEIDVR